MLLSLTTDVEVGHKALTMTFDHEGLELLQSCINNAIASGHDHLWTWGNDPELTVYPEIEGKCFKHLKVVFDKEGASQTD